MSKQTQSYKATLVDHTTYERFETEVAGPANAIGWAFMERRLAYEPALDEAQVTNVTVTQGSAGVWIIHIKANYEGCTQSYGMTLRSQLMNIILTAQQRAILAARIANAMEARFRAASEGAQGDFIDAERFLRQDASTHEILADYCTEVGHTVARCYEMDDGADLCHNLVESGVIDFTDETIDNAARIVAQHMEQQ